MMKQTEINKESSAQTPIKRVATGTIRNKERSKQKLLNAVGEIIRTNGHHALKVNYIAEVAGVDKKLIYSYFDGVDHLIKSYMDSQDVWMERIAPKIADIVEKYSDVGQMAVTDLLLTIFNEVEKSGDMQGILLWELNEYQERLKELADNREALGNEMLKVTDKDFEGTNLDLRAMLAIQIAGIYYLILHSRSNGSTFCGVDMNETEGKKAIKNALAKMVELIYKEANKR